MRSRTRGNALFWRLYMFSWAFVSAGALAYLGAVAINPVNQHHILSSSQTTENQPGIAGVDQAQLSEQVRNLNEKLESLHSELARVKEQRTAPAPAATATTHSAESALEPPPAMKPAQTESEPTRPLEPEFAATSDVATASIRPRQQATPVQPFAGQSSITFPPPAPDAPPQATATTETAPVETASRTPPAKPRKGLNLSIRPLKPG
ncbi:MAG: hypothetical protein KKB37_08370, partial [Alphaproteobacteria bacterium]|nr:hypothetical protein [Alphaproteobacteria bacterium]